MQNSEKTKKTEEKNVTKKKGHIEALRRNIDILMDEHNYTIKELAEKADITFESLRTFLYDKDAIDCRLSTAVKLSRVFGVTIAELAETGTIEDHLLKTIKSFRKLSKSEKSLIEFLIDYYASTHEQHSSKRDIWVMRPICNNDGNLKKTNDYYRVNIDDVGEEIIHKAFMGIEIPCEHYLPHYLEGQILLIANDRNPIGKENSVIIVNGNIIITHRVVENGKAKYYGVRDKLLHSEEDDRIYVVGYIAKVIDKQI